MPGPGDIILDPATVERLAWTLLHSLWQGAVVALLLAIAMVVMQRRSAHVRYVVLCLGLVTMLAAPIVTFWYLRGTFDDPGPLVLETTPAATVAAAPQGSGYPARIAAAVRPWTGRLLLAWTCGVCAFSLQQLLAWAVLQRLLLRETLPLDERWRRLTDVANKLRLPQVRFFQSSICEVPATAGWLRPVVLLPASALTGLTPEQLEAIVAHELAHIRRRDYLVNLLQTAAEVILFYNPAVWWVSRRIRQERENCCDDIAATVTDGGGRSFADALLALEERRATMPLAMAATGGALWQRVARLVGATPRRRLRAAPMAVLLAATVVTVGAAHVLGSAVYVRPQRQLSDVKSLCAEVYEIVAIAPSEESFLPALDAALSEQKGDGSAFSLPSLDGLAAALNRSRPDELQALVLPQVRIDAPMAAQHSASWKYGTPGERERLAKHLWDAARTASPERPEQAAVLGRAAVLLSAQDSFMFGLGRLPIILAEPDFVRVTGLAPRQASRLRRHVSDHRTIVSACGQMIVDAGRSIERMKTSAEHRSVYAEAARQSLADALKWGIGRPDIELRIAATAARLRQETGSPVQLPSLHPDGGANHFERWLAAANNPRPSHQARQPMKVRGHQLRRAH